MCHRRLLLHICCVVCSKSFISFLSTALFIKCFLDKHFHPCSQPFLGFCYIEEKSHEIPLLYMTMLKSSLMVLVC